MHEDPVAPVAAALAVLLLAGKLGGEAATRLKQPGVLGEFVAGIIGLAPIVGAFAAGLVLEDVHFKDFVDRGERPLEELLRPISDVLVPVFFVLMGLRTDLTAFMTPGALGLTAALTGAARARQYGSCVIGSRTVLL
jgi:Kef-type K+ transport system membrane component KefB